MSPISVRVPRTRLPLAYVAIMNQQLLDILQCPITTERLRFATDSELAALRQMATENTLQYRSGEMATSEFDAALINESNDWVYLVSKGIPTMLVDEAIAFESLEKPS